MIRLQSSISFSLFSFRATMSEYISSEEGLTEHEKLEYIVVLICNEAMRSGNFEDLLDLHEIEASVKDRYSYFSGESMYGRLPIP